ncbi:MAG TPA: efflux transporter outer membrane subunit [Steroidobacteraceae bacterium]|jgi:NodT family efflux transporter outer membrane factor (OMF) lipoprotein|nr:efflux transporter outer membrane subunit [Steroidobacteraceae bacterium]
MISRRSHGPATALLAAAIIVALSGCVDRGGWKAASQVAPAQLAGEQALAGVPVDPSAWPAEGWWHRFGDPQLDTLVDAAFAGSPSLTAAEARLRAAQAQALAAGALKLPTVALDAQVDRQRYPENGLYPPPYAGNYYNDGRVAFDLSYDIDFWGRNRALISAARSGVDAAEADRAAARLALAVSVVRAYVQLDLWYALLDVASDQLKQQTSIMELTQQRVTAGLENVARVKQSESTLALTRAGIAAAQANIDLARDQLAALVAAGPDRGLTLTRPHLTAPAAIALPAALPADLLGRRPDVAAARAQVQGAAQGVKAAERDFYPNVNLAAFAGLQSIGLNNLLQGSATIVDVSPALSLPVFNRRQLRGALEARQAQFDASVGQYNQTLIDAVHDVADVVANWRALDRESAEQQTALEAAQRAYDLTTERYRAGLDNYLSVLSAENQLLFAQAVGAELGAQRLTFSVSLVRALGGGYGAAAPHG